MTKLRDDVFLHQQPAPKGPRRLTAADKAALRGIGDRDLRETQDYLWEMGASMSPGVVETANGRFASGDPVEFLQPDGMRVAGQVDELSANGALVTTGFGEKALIPIEALEYPSSGTRRESKRAQIQEALSGGGAPTNHPTETRAPLPVNESGHDFAITLQGWNANKPTEEEVMSYVASHYPGARVLDADASYPGNKLGVVLHLPNGLERTAQGMVPVHSPARPPNDPDPESPGLHAEELPGADDWSHAKEAERRQALLQKTGAAIEAIAAANPSLDFYETSVEVTEGGVISHLAIKQAGIPVFVTTSGELTTVLSQGVAPAIGLVAANDHGVGALIKGPEGELELSQISGLKFAAPGDYDSMHNPATLTRQDEPGAYEDSQYVVKAEGHEADVDVDGAAPGLGYYTKEQYEQELSKYQEEQQRQLMEQERRKQRSKDPRYQKHQLPQQQMQQPQQQQQQPEWLESGPLWEQVKGDAGEEDREHLGGPGLAVAERKDAVDQAAKDYWAGDGEDDGYFTDPSTKGYGEMLVRDIPRRRTEARRMITAAWKEAGARLTAAQLLQAMNLLCTPQQARTAQSEADLASSLAQSRETDPAASNAIEKLVVDYLARNPEALDQLGAFDQALQGAVQYWQAMQPKRIERLRKKFAPEIEELGTAHQPGLMQRMTEKLSPQQRLMREVDTGATDRPQAPQDMPQGYEESFGITEPPAAEEPFDLVFEDEPEQPAAPTPATPPAKPSAPTPSQQPGAGAAAPTPGAPPRKNAPYVPGPEMKVFDEKTGQPIQATGEELLGMVKQVTPQGIVRFELPNKQMLRAFPPGVPTPDEAWGAPQQPPAGQQPAAPAEKPGLGRRLLQKGLETAMPSVFGPGPRGGGRQAYKPLPSRADADNPTPGTYHEQSATDNYAGRRPPAKAALGFQLKNLRRRGDYVVGDVVWDTERTKAMSSKNVEHNIISFVKGRSTMKDPIDLGNIGRVRVKKLDVHAGVAEVVFRSSEARALPPEQIIQEEGVIHHDPLT